MRLSGCKITTYLRIKQVFWLFFADIHSTACVCQEKTLYLQVIMKMKILPIISALFLVIAMAIQSAVSYHHIKENLVSRIENRMELAQKDILSEVYDMYEATDEITYFFPKLCSDSNEVSAMLKTVMERFPNLYCCYVSYLPECSPKEGKLYAPCAFFEHKNSIIVYDFGDKVNYLKRDWYTGALQSNDKGYWSQPYNDGDHEDPVFTYSRKVYDNEGKMVGVAGADYTLVWTERMLENIKPYDDAFCQLFSTNGTLIVESGSGDMSGMIVTEKILSPTNMRLVIGVPRTHVLKDMRSVSLLTLTVLLMGILIAGWLIRRIWRNQEEYTRVETAKKLMEQELQIASDIQRGILRNNSQERLSGTPTIAESDKDAEVGATLVPMREVGGDLYDYCRKEDNLFFIIGDVSGKGVPAAILMSATVNLFRSAVQRLQSPKAIMEEMNSVLSEHNPSMMFVTAIIGRLHVPTGQLLYCNAGHLPPLEEVQMNNDKRCLKEIELEPNIPMGYEEKYQFVEQSMTLGQGDALVLYTDGITEAFNMQHEMMGMERWKEIVGGVNMLQGISISIERLLAGVMTFIGKAEQADDITLLIIRKISATT